MAHKHWSQPQRLPMKTDCDHHVMAAIAILISAALFACMILGALGLLPI